MFCRLRQKYNEATKRMVRVYFFQTMNHIKTSQRNRLTTDTLDRLVCLSAEGPPLEDFDFEAAATKWANKSNRKLNIHFVLLLT